MNWLSICLVMSGLFIFAGCFDGTSANAKLKVYPQAQHEIDVRLFGQFLERASFGDHGPEAFVDPETGKLPEKIVDMLKAMQIPVIRFPGGTDIDYIDWRDMIDNVPGREGPRPVTKSYRPKRDEPFTITNHFGYDEYFELRDQLDCETILVVNLLDALAKRVPVEQAAMHAAGLIAYVNAPVGAKLPEGMPDWPAIRAKNGHPEPYNVEYVQIGNEIFLGNVRKMVAEATGKEYPDGLCDWYRDIYTAYIKAIRSVDSDIEIIFDAWLGEPISETVQTDEYIKANTKFMTVHRYAPGGVSVVKKDKEDVDPETLSDADYWWALTSMPGIVDGAGQNIGFADGINAAYERGYDIAATEWNWNGWSWQEATESFEAPSAAGIGAAAFIHGLLRSGDKIKMANQSMLLGNGWAIAAIFGDPSGEHEPYYNPQGSSTTFYRMHHGEKFLKSELSGVKTHPQPYSFSWGGGVDKEVAELDVLVTADDDRVFVHAINRNFDRDLNLNMDLTAFDGVSAKAMHHKLWFKLFGEEGYGFGRGMAQRGIEEIPAGETMTVTMPARTVSIIEIPLSK